MPKRFIIVEISGQYYEVERPYGCEQFMVMVSWKQTPFLGLEIVDKVWVEPA